MANDTVRIGTDDDLDNMMQAMMKKEMLMKIESKISNGDKDILNAIKMMISEDDNPKDSF